MPLTLVRKLSPVVFTKKLKIWPESQDSLLAAYELTRETHAARHRRDCSNVQLFKSIVSIVSENPGGQQRSAQPRRHFLARSIIARARGAEQKERHKTLLASSRFLLKLPWISYLSLLCHS